MNTSLSEQDQLVLDVLSRVRAMTSKTAARYKKFGGASEEALRKRMERLAQRGLLATSDLPSGVQIFRLTKKALELTGSPPSWSTAPSPGVLAESLSVSGVAWHGQLLFPTSNEFDEILKDLAGEKAEISPRVAQSRFVLRSLEQDTEIRVDYWLAELRPAVDLVRRAEVIAKKLNAEPIFAKLSRARLLGLSVAVPSDGVRQTLARYTFALPTEIVVVEELKHLTP